MLFNPPWASQHKNHEKSTKMVLFYASFVAQVLWPSDFPGIIPGKAFIFCGLYLRKMTEMGKYLHKIVTKQCEIFEAVNPHMA